MEKWPAIFCCLGLSACSESTPLAPVGEPPSALQVQEWIRDSVRTADRMISVRDRSSRRVVVLSLPLIWTLECDYTGISISFAGRSGGDSFVISPGGFSEGDCGRLAMPAAKALQEIVSASDGPNDWIKPQVP